MKSVFSELANNYAAAKAKTDEAYEAYKILKSVQDSLKDELMTEVLSQGLRSVKTQDWMVSIGERESIRIIEEEKIIKWIEDNPELRDKNVYIGLKKAPFDQLYKQARKQTGEIIPGTEIERSQYITLKEVK